MKNEHLKLKLVSKCSSGLSSSDISPSSEVSSVSLLDSATVISFPFWNITYGGADSSKIFLTLRINVH